MIKWNAAKEMLCSMRSWMAHTLGCERWWISYSRGKQRAAGPTALISGWIVYKNVKVAHTAFVIKWHNCFCHTLKQSFDWLWLSGFESTAVPTSTSITARVAFRDKNRSGTLLTLYCSYNLKALFPLFWIFLAQVHEQVRQTARVARSRQHVFV